MIIDLIRHGETVWNQEHRFQGRTNLSLDENGIREAVECARNCRDAGIDWDRIYVSPLKRARETAEILADGREIPVTVDERLIEFSFGECEGELTAQVTKDPEHCLWGFLNDASKFHGTPGGETYDQVRTRVRDFFEEVIYPLEKEGVERVLIVSHGGLISETLCWSVGKEREGYCTAAHVLTNCCLCRLKLQEGKFSLLAIAATDMNEVPGA